MKLQRMILVTALLGALSASVAARQPNVVIVFTDDQGTLDANCFGSRDLHTPNIDKLADTGVRFTQAYAHTVCCPARAAIMTGRHPQRCNVNSWTQGNMNGPKGINMHLSEVTLAEALKPAGYSTALFGKWHLGSHRDFAPKKQGFDEFFGIRNGFIDNFNHFQLHGAGYHDLYEGATEVFKRGEYFPELIVNRSMEFIDRNKDKPFLLYVGFNIPHYPEQALKEHEERYKNLPMPRRAYAAIVTTTDHYIGKILDRLEKHGLREDTIVVFQSDNGHSEEDYQIRPDNHNSGYPKGHNYGANGGGGNTGKWIGRKGTFLEGGVRTPAIISYPAKLPQGVVRDQAVTAMDWFPTIMELTGAPKTPNKLDGRSLLPVIRSSDAPSPHETLYFQWQNNWAVREGEWKLIRKKGRGAKAKEDFSLLNLAEEKPEVTNHAKERPEIVARLKKRYSAWAEDVFAKGR